MRRITRPAPNMPAIEDVVIHYYDFDGFGNIAMKQHVIEIPVGLGRFCAAAMGLGFVEFFDKELQKVTNIPTQAGPFKKMCEDLLTEMRKHYETVAAQQAAQKVEANGAPKEIPQALRAVPTESSEGSVN